MSSRAAPPSELRWPRRLVPTCLADTFYGSWDSIAKSGALEAHALHLNLNRVRYQQRCRECGLARKTRRATHMFRSRFGFYVQGATGECFCGCLEPPGGRDTSGRASVQHLQISVTGKGLISSPVPRWRSRRSRDRRPCPPARGGQSHHLVRLLTPSP